MQKVFQGRQTNFVTLQAAWDKSDIHSLRAMMTDEMLKEIQSQLAERGGAHRRPGEPYRCRHD